jgi:transposase
MRNIGSPAELEHRRCLAVERVVEGYTTREVGDFLGVDPRSVRRWAAAFRTQGVRGLAAQPASGRPPFLTRTQEKIVWRWLADNPVHFGFTTELWTAGRVARLIEQEWHVHFHPHYLSAWLRTQGFSPQKPERVPRERNLQRLAQWRAEDWPRIKRQAHRRGSHVVFLDESGLLLAPLLRRTWAPCGQTPVLQQRSKYREKVSAAAALWWPPGRERLGLNFWTLVNGYFTNVGVAVLLGELLGALGAPLTVIWDGGMMHKGDPINDLLRQAAGRLWLERLPPYGSELMPIEYLWSCLKYGRLCNFAAYDVKELNKVAQGELTAIQKDQKLVTSFFHAAELSLPRTLLT